MRCKGIIHFDGHFGNILTDGKQIYLTDFGLALDRSFALDDEERRFFEQHIYYDLGELMRNIGRVMQWYYAFASASAQQSLREKYGIADGLEIYELGPILLDNIQSIHADNILELDPYYVAMVVKYRSIIALAHNFFAEMWNNNAKDTSFPHVQLQQLLEESGLL